MLMSVPLMRERALNKLIPYRKKYLCFIAKLSALQDSRPDTVTHDSQLRKEPAGVLDLVVTETKGHGFSSDANSITAVCVACWWKVPVFEDCGAMISSCYLTLNWFISQYRGMISNTLTTRSGSPLGNSLVVATLKSEQ